MPRTSVPLILASFAALAVSSLAPSEAQACGGTFCDNTGVPMPVDQAGEDILFVQDGPEIEVHIRIQYEGEAERFAWLVPIQAVPEISVGSEALFMQLAAATAPRWIRQDEFECPDENWGASSGGFVPDGDFSGASEDPDVVLEAVVGAFEIVVLQGGTAAEVIEFLDQNGYQQDPDAAPILQEYLDEGFLFAAVKLTAGASADSIHPLVFRMIGDEPCVPIRLTRIAAQQDMGIRAYFLGQERWAPQNYKHVVLNPLAFPWSELAGQNVSEYTELLSLAVDEAGGRAFATEYAGTSEAVAEFGVYADSWDETAFVGLNMIQALNEIADQALNTHPMIQVLLLEYMPPPDGVDPQQFWNNIEAFADSVDIDNWDSAGFAAALSERIIEPGLHAVDLLGAWPYLTRLNTTMSPNEMLLDPMFHPAPTLAEVANTLTTTSLDLCGDTAGNIYTVPFGDTHVPVCLAEWQWQWPAALGEHAALRIEKIPAVGPPHVLEDFSAEILAAQAAHQAASQCADDGEDPTDGQDPTDGEDSTDGETGDAGVSDVDSKAACACRSDERDSPLGASMKLGLLGLAAFGWGRRRRRQRV